MQLSAKELEEFDSTGYVFKPGAFSETEAAVLRQAAAEVYAMERKEVWREKTGAPRTAFAAHTYNCLLYTSPSPRDKRQSRMPSSA